MKIVFVTRGYPSKKDLMLGNYEAVQAKALAKKGIDVSVFCTEKHSMIHIFNRNKVEAFDDEGVHVYKCHTVLPIIPKMRFLSNGRLNNWILSRSLFRLFQQYCDQKGEPDIIHAHIIVLAFRCKYILERHNIPLVITEHWSVLNYPTISNQNLYRWSKSYYKADQVISVSSKLAESLKKKFDVDSLVIGNMVDNRFFSEPKLSPRKGFLFVSVGNLLPRKGFDLLIKGFAKCEFVKDVKLQIVGGGEEMANLQQLIDKLGVGQQVKLLGQKTPDEVSNILAESDCYVLSSHIETFGIVIIEALAKGLPVVATRCGGPEDIIDSSNGLLIPVDDIDALAVGMKTIYTNIDVYDRKRIKQDCYDNFSEESITNKIVDVYKSVLINRNKDE